MKFPKRWSIYQVGFIAFLFVSAGDSPATIYYVDQNHWNANDSNPGTGEDSPWKTLQRAMSVIAGDTVYVKNGTYDAGPTMLNPVNSGTPGAPIAFRAFIPPMGARHRPVINRSVLNPLGGLNFAIGISGRNHITWDGFVLSPGTASVVRNSTDIILENVDINLGGIPCVPGNFGGVYIDNVTNAIVRNSRIRGPFYSPLGRGCYAPNASSIWMIRAYNILIQNNELSNSGAGINIKRIAHNHIYERNYIYDIDGTGWAIGIGFGADQSCSGPACRTSDIIARNNIIVRVGNAFNATAPPSAQVYNLQFYNNTVYGVKKGISGGAATTRQYNNVIHLDMSWFGRAHLGYWNNPPTDLLSDYSVYYDSTALRGRFYPVESGAIGELTLSQWQSYQERNLDRNSRTVNPQFVGPLSGALSPLAFQLQPTSPLRNAGREGGVSTGAPVNIGAYAIGSETIGIIPAASGVSSSMNAPSNALGR